MKLKQLAFFLFTLCLLLFSCQKSVVAPNAAMGPGSQTGLNNRKNLATTPVFDEGFESASKTAYAAADVAFGSGSWNLNDALIGTSTSDAKVGTHSVRIRNTGTLSMNFDVSTGASTVTMSYALYGADGSSAFQLWVSSNGGSKLYTGRYQRGYRIEYHLKYSDLHG
jgi:endonuclease G